MASAMMKDNAEMPIVAPLLSSSVFDRNSVLDFLEQEMVYSQPGSPMNETVALEMLGFAKYADQQLGVSSIRKH